MYLTTTAITQMPIQNIISNELIAMESKKVLLIYVLVRDHAVDDNSQ